jgi:hypothetical protein
MKNATTVAEATANYEAAKAKLSKITAEAEAARKVLAELSRQADAVRAEHLRQAGERALAGVSAATAVGEERRNGIMQPRVSIQRSAVLT